MRRLSVRGYREIVKYSIAVVLADLCIACTVPIARDLDDGSANQMAVALQRAGTASSKEPDPEHDGRWMLTVPRGELPHALDVLVRERLPSPPRPGLSDLSEQNSIVPSLHVEQARLLTGISNDLERTLTSVYGMSSARVHLALGRWDPLSQAENAVSLVPSASVLVTCHAGLCPLSLQDIQRIVAGAVAIPPEKVQVVTAPATETRDAVPRMVTFGPFTVLRESARLLRVAVGVGVTLNLTTLGLLIYFWQRAKRGGIG